MSLAEEERPRSYATQECGTFESGWSHGPIFHDYSRSRPHPCLDDHDKPARRGSSLDDELAELRSPEFSDQFSRLRSGREDSIFGTDMALAKVIRHLREGGRAASASVERLLDDLFKDLRKGEEFAHTEVVMAVLFALQRAESPFFREVADVLAQSRAAELGRLSRYAKRLLGR